MMNFSSALKLAIRIGKRECYESGALKQIPTCGLQWYNVWFRTKTHRKRFTSTYWIGRKVLWLNQVILTIEFSEGVDHCWKGCWRMRCVEAQEDTPTWQNFPIIWFGTPFVKHNIRGMIGFDIKAALWSTVKAWRSTKVQTFVPNYRNEWSY